MLPHEVGPNLSSGRWSYLGFALQPQNSQTSFAKCGKVLTASEAMTVSVRPPSDQLRVLGVRMGGILLAGLLVDRVGRLKRQPA